MIDRLELAEIIELLFLSFLQMSDLYAVSSGLYESLKDKNQMCELCMFSQIRSQIYQLIHEIGHLFIYVCTYVRILI